MLPILYIPLDHNQPILSLDGGKHSYVSPGTLNGNCPIPYLNSLLTSRLVSSTTLHSDQAQALMDDPQEPVGPLFYIMTTGTLMLKLQRSHASPSRGSPLLPYDLPSLCCSLLLQTIPSRCSPAPQASSGENLLP
jgi:hypothetical protein